MTEPTTAKSAFITRKGLIAACLSMDLDTVLFAASRRTPTQHRGRAVEVGLALFIDVSFGQQFHTNKSGTKTIENPAWFKQLYTDLAWSMEDITPGAILQVLC